MAKYFTRTLKSITINKIKQSNVDMCYFAICIVHARNSAEINLFVEESTGYTVVSQQQSTSRLDKRITWTCY